MQQYLFVPQKYKDCYTANVLNEFSGQAIMVFTSTCAGSQKLTLVLRALGFPAIPLNGNMNQAHRFLALEKFKSRQRSVLVATDVASRGIDIPFVDLVINYDVPVKSEDYIHRVGRTARAGRGGRAVTIVTQYDVEVYQRIEALIKKKLDQFPAQVLHLISFPIAQYLQILQEDVALALEDRVAEAHRVATEQMKEIRKKEGTDDGGVEGGQAEEGADHDDTVVTFTTTKAQNAKRKREKQVKKKKKVGKRDTITEKRRRINENRIKNL